MFIGEIDSFGIQFSIERLAVAEMKCKEFACTCSPGFMGQKLEEPFGSPLIPRMSRITC